MVGMSTFEERVAGELQRLSPAEQRVALFFRENREEVLVASAATLAGKIGTSDATVVRTAKALGYGGLDELRRQLATELRRELTPASRLTRTLDEVGDNLESAFDRTLNIHVAALERLRRDIPTETFQTAVDRITAAARVRVFGLGPSSAVAEYFVIQLCRFGLDADVLRHTGLLLADDLSQLRHDDLVVVLAYGRVYRELDALLSHADRLGLFKVLLTDTLGSVLRDRVDLVLTVARGRADRLSMHTATLGLIEALLVGVAVERPTETVASLKQLNDLRTAVAGKAMDLPLPNVTARSEAIGRGRSGRRGGRRQG